MEKVNILDVRFDNISCSELIIKLKQGGVVFTPNVDHIMKIRKDSDFAKIYEIADYCVCDSQILLWLSRFFGQPILEKISGSDLFPAFCQYYKEDTSTKVFLLGAPEGVAAKAKEKINRNLGRELVVGVCSPPFGFENNETASQEIINLINQSGANVLAVGLGAPKQEKWIFRYKNQLKNVKVFFAIGAAIEFEAGFRKRAPKWLSQVGLEWFYRLILEPKRLWKRYLVESLPLFPLIIRQKVKSDLSRQYLKSKRTSDLIVNSLLNNPKKIMEKLNIIMLGPSLNEKGGMGAVATLIIETAPPQVQIEHLSTWDGEQSTLKLFTQALITYLYKLSRGKVDLVHVNVSERGSVLRKSIIALIGFIFKKPVIMHMHGCEFHSFYMPLPQKIKRAINWILQHCTYVIVLSKSWQEFYITSCQIKPEKVVILPNPVKLPTEVPKRQTSSKLDFLFLGKINERKGVYDLLEAFAKLAKEKRQNAQLILAGSGELKKARQVAKTYDIAHQVQFPGWIAPTQRNEMLAKADVFVLPSYNEGLPMALLEAMSWSLPVITTPVGGIPEVITHQETGLLINPGNTGQLSVAIQLLIENEILRQNLGLTARKRVASHDINDYSTNLSNLYITAKKENQDSVKLTNITEVHVRN